MVSKNDITGDSIKSKTGDQKKYSDGWDAIFGKKDKEMDDTKDFKEKQQDMTELNGDGNRERGRYGEDERERFSHPAYTRYPHLKDVEKALDDIKDDLENLADKK
jgi:hypothetical protein